MKIKSIEQMSGSYDMLENYRTGEYVNFEITFEETDSNGINAISLSVIISEVDTLDVGGKCWESNGDNLEYSSSDVQLLEIEEIEYYSIHKVVNDDIEEMKSGLKMKYFEAVKDEVINFLNDKLK